MSSVRRPSSRPARMALAALAVSLSAACAPASEPTSQQGAVEAPAPAAEVGIDNLNAVLWVQSAVEYRALALQAYALGRRALDQALVDDTWTAALEQIGDYADLPPAVIVDVDETVLDNSYYEARLTLDGQSYEAGTWDAWVLQEAATAVPGAKEFLDYAADRGVTVFYVSNRRAHLEEATRANLAALEMPLDDQVDTVLLRGEIPEWDTSDKTPRRRRVASDYRVLLMFGDNMGDFTAASSGTVAERAAFADAHGDYWGSRWIMLPNPTYGSFIGAVLGDESSAPWPRQVEIKKQALDPAR